MVKTILKIDGMMCGMCETHVNDLIRKTFEVTKVSSSHIKNETMIRSKNFLDRLLLEKVLEESGYKLISFVETNN